MSSKGRNIIVIGTSAGGLDALDELVGELAADIPASIFIVRHMVHDFA
jgi:two-component system chemotaxis response regulator CheB